MTIDFEKGNFVVYEGKKAKGQERLNSLKYFDNFNEANTYMANRLITEVYESDDICGYTPEEITIEEAERTSLKYSGALIREKKTNEFVLILSLFVSPTAVISPYDF